MTAGAAVIIEAPERAAHAVEMPAASLGQIAAFVNLEAACAPAVELVQGDSSVGQRIAPTDEISFRYKIFILGHRQILRRILG
jgi:hypothetical protein